MKGRILASLIFSLLASSLVLAQTAVRSASYDESLRQIESLRAEESKTISDQKHMTQLMTHGQKTKYVLLSIPGLHESPFYLQGLNNFFFNEGANVLSLHLPGHQQKDETQLNKVKAQSWEEAVSDALTIAHGLGDEVLILGYSTGGGLAVQAALARPKEISQLFLFAPSIGLSSKTFLFSFFGQLAGNKKLCDLSKPGFFCKMFEALDHQGTQMLKEGTYPSAQAGMQVQKIINDMQAKYGDSENADYFQVISDIYSTLQVPVFMVSSEADTIVSPRLNHSVFERLTVRKAMVEYPKNLKISHLMITKSKADALPHSPNDSYNPYFDELLPKIKMFWKGE